MERTVPQAPYLGFFLATMENRYIGVLMAVVIRHPESGLSGGEFITNLAETKKKDNEDT